MNQRRNANVIRFAPIATWVLLGIFAGSGGLFFVYCKNKLHERGGYVKQLEKELVELRNANEVARARVAMLSSPNVLRKLRAQNKNFLAGYVEITQDSLVVMSETAPGASQLRPVSNDQR